MSIRYKQERDPILYQRYHTSHTTHSPIWQGEQQRGYDCNGRVLGVAGASAKKCIDGRESVNLNLMLLVCLLQFGLNRKPLLQCQQLLIELSVLWKYNKYNF